MKKWYLSKTIWINLIALIGVALETATGKEILDPAAQGIILTVINLVLRFVTKQGISFKQIEKIINVNVDAAVRNWPDSTPKVEVKPMIIPVQAETPSAAQETTQTTQPDPAQATTEQPKV